MWINIIKSYINITGGILVNFLELAQKRCTTRGFTEKIIPKAYLDKMNKPYKEWKAASVNFKKVENLKTKILFTYHKNNTNKW